MRNRTLDLVVYAIPAAIFVFALVMGVRVLWPEPPAPVTAVAPEISFAAPCAAGRYRCRAAQVEVMTGEERVIDAATNSER